MFGHSAYLPSNTAAVASAGIRPSGSEGPSTDAVRISSAVGLGIAHAKIGDKIASVVAAFTVVLRAANPSRTTAPAGGKLPSLRALCGSLIGPQIEQSVASKRDEEGEEHEEDDESNEWASEEEEDDDSAVVDQWYESIPEHLRRWVASASDPSDDELTFNTLKICFGIAFNRDHGQTITDSATSTMGRLA
jgi:hypothetical protein